MKRILLIEDEDSVAEYLGGFLRQAGYDTDWVSGGRAAETRAGQSQYELILLDLMLSDTTGDLLLPTLRATQPDTPILIVSGVAFDDPRLLFCLNNGAAGYIPKAARADELLTTVRSAMRE